MKLKTIISIGTGLLLAAVAMAQPPTNAAAPAREAVMVDTNGVLKAPTNFFAANSNLLNAAVAGGGGGGSGTVTAVSGPSIVTWANPTTTPTGTLNTQTSNTFLAGPTSGSAAAPTFRALGNADFNVTLTPTFSGSNLTHIQATNTEGLLSVTPVIITNSTTNLTLSFGTNLYSIASSNFTALNFTGPAGNAGVATWGGQTTGTNVTLSWPTSSMTLNTNGLIVVGTNYTLSITNSAWVVSFWALVGSPNWTNIIVAHLP